MNENFLPDDSQRMRDARIRGGKVKAKAWFGKPSGGPVMALGKATNEWTFLVAVTPSKSTNSSLI
ncbi:MAG TPA: hypothetical protein VGC39_08620 [Candidatus Methylacidiphilales bacterium]